MTNLEHATALLAGANYCGNEQTPSGAACARCIAKVLENAYARGFAEAIESAAKVPRAIADSRCSDWLIGEIERTIRALVPNAVGEQGG